MIRVESRQVTEWESRCGVEAVKALPTKSSVSLSCSGEGEKWKRNEVWDVDYTKNGDVLIISASGKDKPATYVRCK